MSTVYQLNNQAMSEEQRMKNFIQQKRTEGHQVIQNQEDAQNKDLTESAARFEKEKEHMEKAFEVSLSKESKQHAEKLAAVREAHNKEVAELKQNNEKDFAMEQERASKRLSGFTKKQEEVIAKLHARYQQAQEEIRRNNGDI